MKKLRKFCLALLIAACANVAHAGGCASSALIAPLDVIGHDTEALLQNEDFKTLEQLSARYHKLEEVSTDGQPKLMGYFRGVGKSFSECGKIDSEDNWAEHRRLLEKWGKAYPRSVTAQLALVNYYISYAWHARGGGYADGVSDGGWKLFGERTDQAKALLDRNKSKFSGDPLWHELTLEIGTIQGWDAGRFDKVYEEGVKKFPRYLDLYYQMGSFHSAQWHGSNDEFKTYVEQVVAVSEPRDGQTMYARLNWSARDHEMFFDGRTDWKRMKQGFERLVLDYPDPWNLNNFARHACMAGDTETFSEVMERVGDKFMPSAWDNSDQFRNCRQLADAIKKVRDSPNRPTFVRPNGELVR